MKKINKLLFGLMMLSCVLSDVFAKDFGTGYIWIAGTNKGFDSINYIDLETEYVLKADLNKGLPDINSVIKIEPKNRIYYDIRVIEAISKEYLFLTKNNKCESGLGSFTAFMTNNGPKECTIDNLLKKIKNDYLENDISDTYNEFTLPIKAKVLGYVFTSQGTFMTVEIWK